MNDPQKIENSAKAYEEIKKLDHFKEDGTVVYLSPNDVPKESFAKYSEFFTPHEFADTRSGLTIINTHFMKALLALRVVCPFPFIINSGTRSQSTNRIVGGHPTSAHLVGLAADVRVDGGTQAMRIVKLAAKKGFMGIGVKRPSGARGYVHLDIVPRKEPTIWTYSY